MSPFSSKMTRAHHTLQFVFFVNLLGSFFLFSSVQPLNRVQLCDPMDCSVPGFPVLHYLPVFAQTHVHCVDDAIQPAHPLVPLSPPAFSLSQYQGLSNEMALHIRWPKCWSFSISPPKEYSGLISFRID